MDKYLECVDNNGDIIKLTPKGFAAYHKERGNADGNIEKTIARRYRDRKKLGYDMRQVCGFVEISHNPKSKPKIKLSKTELIIKAVLGRRLVFSDKCYVQGYCECGMVKGL